MSPIGAGGGGSSAISGSSITSGSHLLSVPGAAGNSSNTPYLVKQHSHPLLLTSHSSLDSGSSHHPLHHPHHYLHRQLSFPSENLLVPISASSSSLGLSTLTTVTTGVSPPPPPQQSHHQDVAMRAISPTIVVVSDSSPAAPPPASSSSQPPPLIPSVSTESFPSIRIKGEELQRSMSSPLVSNI